MLAKWREQIDALDQSLIDILEERLSTVEKIGQFKLEQKTPVLNEEREQEQMKKWKANIKKEESTDYIIAILLKVVEMSRLKQNNMILKEDESHEISIL